MRLRSGRISPGNTEMSPKQRFPFKSPTAALPLTEPDYHLVHTAIPIIFPSEQSRSFPQQPVRFLASFANKVSISDNALIPASNRASDPLSTIFTQGRLHCSQHRMIPPNRFNPCSWSKCTAASIFSTAMSNLPKVKVSTVEGSTPACHCRSPLNLNSQHQPTTGRNKPTQGTSSMCP